MPAPLIALAFKLLPLLSAVPEVIDSLKGGNAEQAASKVFDVAKKVAGVDDPDAAATAIINKPELQLQFQQALIAERVEYAKLASAERIAQIEVNKVESASDDKFKSRWRPAVGWVCVIALALSQIPKALVLTLFWCWQAYIALAHPEMKLPELPPFPDLGVGDAIALLMSLLGLAGMRSLERVKGVA